MVLECCHAAKARILVTGDNDLLGIADLPIDLRIMKPQTFIAD